jgi:hypothetical protein
MIHDVEQGVGPRRSLSIDHDTDAVEPFRIQGNRAKAVSQFISIGEPVGARTVDEVCVLSGLRGISPFNPSLICIIGPGYRQRQSGMADGAGCGPSPSMMPLPTAVGDDPRRCLLARTRGRRADVLEERAKPDEQPPRKPRFDLSSRQSRRRFVARRPALTRASTPAMEAGRGGSSAPHRRANDAPATSRLVRSFRSRGTHRPPARRLRQRSQSGRPRFGARGPKRPPALG